MYNDNDSLDAFSANISTNENFSPKYLPEITYLLTYLSNPSHKNRNNCLCGAASANQT